MKEQETETYPPLYRQPITYAAEHGEKDAYRRSWELNQECKRAVEEAISQNFDGMHLDKDAVKPVLEEYGAERLSFILANTLKQEEWDARFSRDNVAWATEFLTLRTWITVQKETCICLWAAIRQSWMVLLICSAGKYWNRKRTVCRAGKAELWTRCPEAGTGAGAIGTARAGTGGTVRGGTAGTGTGRTE